MTSCALPHPDGAFYQHIHENIVANSERRPIYRKLTGGKSNGLTYKLIALEKLSLLAARLIDWWAQKYQSKGIPIITNDLVPLHQQMPPSTPPVYNGRASKALLKEVGKIIAIYKKEISKNTSNYAFTKIADASYRALEQIAELEKMHNCHFAMTIHIIESIGLASLNAPDYVRQSHEEICSLSKWFIKLQAFALHFSLGLDKQAQAVHALGYGVLVNDLPPIPFCSKYQMEKGT